MGDAIRWNSGKIRQFITVVFTKLELPVPDEATMYWTYLKFDRNGDWELDQDECLSLIEQFYLAMVNKRHGEPPRSKSVQKKAVTEAVHKRFDAVDTDKSLELDWNNGEIREFIRQTCQDLALPVPSEVAMGAMVAKYDADENGRLDFTECRAIVQTLAQIRSAPEDDNATRCDGGHTMTLFITPDNTYSCFKCGVKRKTAEMIWRCEKCEIYKCVACAKMQQANSA